MGVFERVLEKYRKAAFSSNQELHFERLMRAYLKTDARYAGEIEQIWLWDEFFAKEQFGEDSGIDLVAYTRGGEFWAIQCKIFAGNCIDKQGVDSFLAASSREFEDPFKKGGKTQFSQRLFISTTNEWSGKAEEAIKNQNPPLIRMGLADLESSAVDWEKLEQGFTGEQAKIAKKEMREHQITALEKTLEYFLKNDRGKLIMACGTGKTFTSLKIAENQTKGNGLVLFLTPSIALLSQTLREWMTESNIPLYPIVVCSDPKVVQKEQKSKDISFESLTDLALPASTSVESILKRLKIYQARRKKNGGMIVLFSTYQSIHSIIEAQKKLSQQKYLSEFDLIICDEAHRTTGVSLSNQDESNFIKVHNNKVIKAKKRLYMTATPKLYDENSKSKAKKLDATLCSMDDEELYGKQIHKMGFGEAVGKKLLTDYKVLILLMSEKDISPELQEIIAQENFEINSDDASKLMGCINAISKQVFGDDGFLESSDPLPMKKVLAFCQNIKKSKKISDAFNKLKKASLKSEKINSEKDITFIDSQHIDGSMSSPQRDKLLNWLKLEEKNSKSSNCKILTNVKCLSEGVDLPSLDGVLFLSAKNSQIDVVQSVGRVMRKAPHKKWGYIVIPVVVPSGVEPEIALNNNQKYQVIWSVLSALRSHDDRFETIVNQIDLNKKKPLQILVGVSPNIYENDSNELKNKKIKNLAEQLQFEKFQATIYTKMVQKVGSRRYWEDWAQDVAQIAQNEILRIKKLVSKKGRAREIFQEFLSTLQENINPSISEEQTIEMLSQHMITKPVFEALFEGYSFIKNNSVSKSMQRIIDSLEKSEKNNSDLECLERFYQSVKKRASGIDNAKGKQKVIVELYDQFFQTAFPRMVDQLGIVYTPVELVDFMISSVNTILQIEFGREITEENVHILDPFAGTGTFITRLLQSGLIKSEDLERKYTQEIHANEIILLAYYIAAINIENAYHDLIKNAKKSSKSKKEKFVPFRGIVLTDTFQLAEKEGGGLPFEYTVQNSNKAEYQKKTPIKVIIGNPPYSIGQSSANDNAKNQVYPKLHQRIAETYAKEGDAQLQKSLYDSYIKAFRWATDCLKDEEYGVVMFVTNNGWIDANSMDGFRKCLEKEFTKIHIYNLKGDQRTSGELSRKEGGKIFASGSRAGIAVTALIKNPNYKQDKVFNLFKSMNPEMQYCLKEKRALIYYNEVADYLSREEKLEKIKKFKVITNLSPKHLKPNEYGDWINQRSPIFEKFIPLSPNEKFNPNTKSFFTLKSAGVLSARDAWVYNFSEKVLQKNIQETINHFNEAVETFEENNIKYPTTEIKRNPKKGNWTRDWKKQLKQKRKIIENLKEYRKAIYRPFVKTNCYFEKNLIEEKGQLPHIFPTQESSNKVICVNGLGGKKAFSAYMTHEIPDLNILDSSTHCFPLYYYQKDSNGQTTLEVSSKNQTKRDGYLKKDAISDFILKEVRKKYQKSTLKVTKEDIFYYVYGVLHSKDYRETFQNNLKKTLPKIPLVETFKDFYKFSEKGSVLSDLHANYENVELFKSVEIKKKTLTMM